MDWALDVRGRGRGESKRRGAEGLGGQRAVLIELPHKKFKWAMREGRSVGREQSHKPRTGGVVVLRMEGVEGGERTSSGPFRPAFASSRTEHRCSGPPVGRSLPVKSSQRVSVVQSTRKQTDLGSVKGGSATSTSHLAWASLPPPPEEQCCRTYLLNGKLLVGLDLYLPSFLSSLLADEGHLFESEGESRGEGWRSVGSERCDPSNSRGAEKGIGWTNHLVHL